MNKKNTMSPGKGSSLIALFSLAFMAITLTGCAANFIRITKLDASGQWIPFADAKLGGYIVEKQGDMSGTEVIYKDGDNLITVKPPDVLPVPVAPTESAKSTTTPATVVPIKTTPPIGMDEPIQ